MKVNSLKTDFLLHAFFLLVFSFALHAEDNKTTQQPLLDALSHLQQGAIAER